jgi:hypothetical protein
MDIDWTKIRETVKRIERELSKADERASRADADVVRDWPLVRREDLEAAFPDWRRDFGPDWRRDFLGKRIGRENYRFIRGTREYRIAPDVFRGLGLSPVRDTDTSSGASATAAPEDV